MPSVPEALIVKRTTNFNDLFAQVDAHISAAGMPGTLLPIPNAIWEHNLTQEKSVSTCVEAEVDITAALEIRESIAAEIEADLAACADLLAEAAAQLKASAEVDVVADNGGCDRSCVETVVVDKSRKFCEDARDVVDRLGEGEFPTGPAISLSSVNVNNRSCQSVCQARTGGLRRVHRQSKQRFRWNRGLHKYRGQERSWRRS